jgi:hypothetical protein
MAISDDGERMLIKRPPSLEWKLSANEVRVYGRKRSV